MNKQVTVKQFAEMVHLTVQAIYKLENTKLKDFISKNENGVKMVSLDALELFRNEKVKQNFVEQLNTEVEHRFNQILTLKDAQIEDLRKQVGTLEMLLSESNRANERLITTIQQLSMVTAQLQEPKKHKSILSRMFRRKEAEE